ncbi:unnamed protein product [Adineta steineri]|uniref:Uncharacterized protein n=3 Tax=Adineta steineri TaxID=433720 RepID=A0A815GT23_9BILA|nr:unnamed protein product [Adineta steineri]CAF1344502.1 unnamed protein product [Adineta steineri]CAF3560136.1 unnamed protein product [Adineta steineri]CAF3843205.1 unnamed protein product [Adineta steineri]
MSEICAVNSCNRVSRALCHCCQENVCIVHLNEHNDKLNSRLNSFTDIINRLYNRIETIDIPKIVDNYHEKLEEWRLDSHKKIDEFFQQKQQELHGLITDKIDEEREEFNYVQRKLIKLIHEQQVNYDDIYELTLNIDHLERELNNIEDKFIQISTHSLILDNNLVNIRGNNEETFDLSILSPVYKTINRPNGSYAVLANNDRNLLIHQVPNLCLINQDLLIFKRISWNHEVLLDMCWSITLNCFILITQKNIFLLNENTMSIEKVKISQKRKWFSCTCSDNFLFLTTNEWGSSIIKISLTSSKKFDKQWQSNDICKKDEYIDVLTHNNGKLAMIIKNNLTSTTRMELRSAETLNRIWSLPLNVTWNPNNPYHCCSFIDDDWLISDYELGRLLHISKTGKINSIVPYNTIPYCATLFGTNILAVSTKDGVNLHNLNYKKTYTIFVL